jgi:Protein of unknown function (DUF3489)
MTKLSKKRSTAKSAASSRKRSSPNKAATKGVRVVDRSGTKQSAAIAMLRSRDGASIDALTQVTGWQQHSVRGFLAGVVRKRLKLDLASTVIEGVRNYRINGGRGVGSAEIQLASQKS